ncbi:SGNH/GDSL hydrolase family protein [Agrococcus beijingensis]|uniref:SGNH/GDSL hydrolase family protein n=1 Tax=Agrococcus beijingensis TaxID=3068634 RepID=UPI002740FB82|nr:SGNH/GDSL hydrolase family protein [Agrococcus sp. REN33]
MELAARLGAGFGAAAADVGRRTERAIHRLARPTAYALAPVLLRQARRAQESLIGLPEPRDERHGQVGEQHDGEPLRLLLVGDSTATGVGAERLEEALAVQTALLLAGRRQRPVAWRIIGQEGSNAADVLRRDLPQVDGPDRDAIVLLVGANDAMQLVSRRAFARSVGLLVDGLAEHLAPGGVIAVAGAPQIDTFAWLPQPMRSLLGGHARSLDDALQRIAAADPRVIHLPTPAILEPAWHASDGFHPSAAGYAMWAQLIAPQLDAALAERRDRAWAGSAPAAAGDAPHAATRPTSVTSINVGGPT